MNIEKHDLVHEFPDHQHTIRHLKTHDSHFAKLFERYNNLDADIRKLEENGQPTTDQVLLDMKNERVQLKDDLFCFIREAETAQ